MRAAPPMITCLAAAGLGGGAALLFAQPLDLAANLGACRSGEAGYVRLRLQANGELERRANALSSILRSCQLRPDNAA